MRIVVLIDDNSAKRMEYIAKALDQNINVLARMAVEEAALGFFRGDPSKDPAKEGSRH